MIKAQLWEHFGERKTLLYECKGENVYYVMRDVTEKLMRYSPLFTRITIELTGNKIG